jgi:non-ribosomal peptide synthetase component F
LQILSEEEEHRLLGDFTDTYTAFPTDKTIVDLFEEQVDKTPAQIALVFGDLQLTYEELNQRANQLAYQLRNKGVIENTLVPICMERSVEMIAGILAILKAGGVYIPIDADYPVERIKYMLTDTAATWVLTSKEVSKNYLK